MVWKQIWKTRVYITELQIPYIKKKKWPEVLIASCILSKPQNYMGYYEVNSITDRSSKAINMLVYFVVLIYWIDSIYSWIAVADNIRLKFVSCAARQNRAPLHTKRKDNSLKQGFPFFCSPKHLWGQTSSVLENKIMLYLSHFQKIYVIICAFCRL